MSRMLSKMNLISAVQQLPSEDIETIQGYVEMIEKENDSLKNQQKEFVKYLEDDLKIIYRDCGHRHKIYEEILAKYKEIIGDIENE